MKLKRVAGVRQLSYTIIESGGLKKNVMRGRRGLEKNAMRGIFHQIHEPFIHEAKIKKIFCLV